MFQRADVQVKFKGNIAVQKFKGSQVTVGIPLAASIKKIMEWVNENGMKVMNGISS